MNHPCKKVEQKLNGTYIEGHTSYFETVKEPLMYETDHSGQDRLTNYMYSVYGLMAGALALTCTTAYYISRIPNIQMTLFGSPILMMFIMIGQLALVISLSAMIQRMTFPMALTMFMVYSVSVGITTSAIFLVYTLGSIVQTFAVASAMFGVMCVYGYITRADLTKLGNVMMMALWGLIIAMLMNLFLQNPVIDLIYSLIGVVVFTLLAAYDTQKLKQIGQHMGGDREMMSKLAVIGALTLYLDFINLFLFLLRFMGKRRD